MDQWLRSMSSVHFAFPFLVFAVVVVSLLLTNLVGIFRERRSRGTGKVKFADSETVRKFGKARNRVSRYSRNIFVLLLVFAAGFLWLHPQIDVSQQDQEDSVSEQDERYLFITQDISSSVTFEGSACPSSGGDCPPEIEEKTAFEVHRESTSNFIKALPGDFRVAWYLFSINSTPYRQPTGDVDAVSASIAKHTLSESTDNALNLSQLWTLSSGTKIREALLYTEERINSLGLEDRLDSVSVVLITDLKYNNDVLRNTLSQLSERGIRVYVLTHVAEGSLKFDIEEFSDNPLVQFYSIMPPEAMDKAFEDILQLETSRTVVEEDNPVPQSIVHIVAIWVLGFLVAGIILLEQFAHRAKGGD